MYLVTAATQFEMDPFLAACRQEDLHRLITGVGPVETAVRLMASLNGLSQKLKGVVNFGVGGAYIDTTGKPLAELLDVCLADSEVLGDLGVCLENGIERIAGKELEVPDTFVMDGGLLELAARALKARQFSFRKGHFVTVNCTSGTAARGQTLARQHQALCENMEGAAVARVCEQFDLPCLEVRCISNFVEDRDTSRWKLKQACRRSGDAAAAIMDYLVEHSHG